MAAATLYVRTGGSDNNGGSSVGTSPDRTGSDGVANGTTTFTSASANFQAGDVDKLINIVGKGRYRITARTNSTTVTLSGSPSSGSGLTWNIGGATATIGALLGNSTAALANGDTIYIGSGTYRETIVCNNTNTAEIQVLGDITGTHTGDSPGPVIQSAYTTNDKTAPSATTLLNLSSRDFLTFKNIVFIGGNAAIVGATAVTSQNITFQDCAFIAYCNGSNNTMQFTGVAGGGTPFNLLIDRCLIQCRGAGIAITVNQAASGTANNDVGVVIKNTLFQQLASTSPINLAGTASTGDKPGGVVIRNCTVLHGTANGVSTSAAWSTTVPVSVTNSFFQGSGASLNANASGQIVESYNLLASSTPRTNVTAGTGSVSDGSYAATYHFGQERLWGGLTRVFAEPMPSSPILGFGNDGNQTAYDLRNKPRPAGGASANPAAGSLERANTFIADPSPIGGGGSAIKVTGPAYAEFLVPVPAATVTISCAVRWDATYAGTKPQLQIDANDHIGVSAETKTATGGSGSNETLTLSSITPTASGMVTVRVISNDTNGAGVLRADDFLVS